MKIKGNLKIMAFALMLNIGQPSLNLPAKSTPTGIPIETWAKETSLASKTISETGTKKIVFAITGYSSTPDQTDETPFTTAANTTVRDGIVATNILPLGTRIKIPRLFGDKELVVEDRMNKRYNNTKILDIWFADRDSAKKFGRQIAEVIVL